MITSKFILMLTIIFLTGLIKQRISVPELKKEKWLNYLVLISCSVSILSFITIVYYNEITLYISRNILGLVDNIFYFIYLICSFIYCLCTYLLLCKMNIKEIPKDCACLLFKKYTTFLMGIQLICCKILI
jgi:phosphatidylserine synthase